MSAIMPIDTARRLYQAADDSLADPAPFMDQSREEIIDRLVSGKTVHLTTSRDIFHSAINDEGYHNVLDLLDSLLALNNKAGDDFFLDSHECAAKVKKVIEDFVDSKPEWIWERACEIASDDLEDE